MALVASGSSDYFSPSTSAWERSDIDWPSDSDEGNSLDGENSSEVGSPVVEEFDQWSVSPKKCGGTVADDNNLKAFTENNENDTTKFCKEESNVLINNVVISASEVSFEIENDNNETFHKQKGSEDYNVQSQFDFCKSMPCDSPPDVRPKVFKNKQCAQDVECDKEVKASILFSKKNKKSKKSRNLENKLKKWRPLDSFYVRFHVTLPFRAANVTDEDADYESHTEEFHQGVENSSNVPVFEGNVCDISEKKDACYHINDINTDDDESFFIGLGIDITNGDPYNDSIIDWDGVVLQKKAKATNHEQNLDKHGIKKPKNYHNQERLKVSNHFDIPTLQNICKSDQYKLFELECASTKKIYIRKDRHKRVQKAHKSIKTKQCRSLLNNQGRKKLYINHRLHKRLDPKIVTPTRPNHLSPVPKGFENVTKRKYQPVEPREPRQARAQNLKYALHTTNAPSTLDSQLTQLLISLQHRELTPEDYDMLLRLDDSVKPKTVSKNVLNNLKTEIVPATGLEVLCTVCMEPYIAGQVRKFLPCGHDFHADCIDTWLKNSSMNCPLDGLPVSNS